MFRLLKLSTFWAIVVGLAFSFTALADTPEIYVYYDGPLGQRIPLILIHGLWAETQSECFNETWATFVEGFIQAELNRFYQLYCFEYPSESMGVERAAEWLAYRLDQYLPRHQVVIVAHSMGGLVARAYMNLKGGGSRVIKLITLATPHHGTPLASLFSIFRRVGKEELQSQAELPRFIPQAIRDDITSLFIVPLTSSDLLWLNRIAWLADIWRAVSPATLQDLEWDSFDGFSAVIPFSLRADFTNPFLDRLNAIVDYDSKIIAYYGGLTVWQLIYWRDPSVTWLDVAIADTRYGVLGSIIATLKGNFSIYSNDGLVPISSGGFEGHLIAKRVFFEGMNHSDMRENPVVISKLVSELWDIVRTLPPPTPRFSLLQATLSASEVRPGQEVFVSIQIQNTGETAGTVPPPPPPSPSGGIVISIEATATRVMPNQEIIVRARITNNGTTYVTMSVPFTVDGKAVMTSNLSIAPGRTEILEFKISFTADQAGTHTIAVGDSPPLTIYVEGPSVSKTPEQFFDSNGNGRLDDSEILTALDYWIKQRPVPDIGVLSDLQILSLLDKWIKGTRIAGQ
jgi:pimeloyl-ACP methyl ester carboxylesterase